MTKTPVFDTRIEHEIVFEAQPAIGRGIDFVAAASFYDWAANVLYMDDEPIAQAVAYGDTEIFNYAACAAWLRQNDPDLDIDDADKQSIMDALIDSRALLSPESDYDDLAGDAKEAALVDLLGPDGAWDGWRVDGDFANQYTLILIPRGKDVSDDGAEQLSPDDWAAAWSRYPDAITESYVTIEVRS